MVHCKSQLNTETHTHRATGRALYSVHTVHVCVVLMTHANVCVYQGVVRAVTGSVSWALPFGFVTDFRGGGGQEEDGGKQKKEEEKKERQVPKGRKRHFGQIDLYKLLKGF